MTAYIIPLIFITVLILSTVKKRNSYEIFLRGSSGAIPLIVEIFPYLLIVMMAIELFRASGMSAVISTALSPALNAIGIPPQLTELMLIRPLSGAGAMGVLDGVYANYGVDTYIGQCASIVYGSSETIFYISAVYFSQSNVRKLRYAVPLSLICTLVGNIVGCLLMRVM